MRTFLPACPSARSPLLRRSRSLIRLAALSVGLLSAGDAAAFCGFFVSGADSGLTNKASAVVLLRDGNRTFLTMSNDYKGPPEDFALVIPVPVILGKSDVKTLKPEVLTHLEKVTAPRLVEYWEQDPCPRESREYQGVAMLAGAVRVSESQVTITEREPDLGVRVEAKFTSGEYQILILSAKESGGLETWLRRSGYKLPAGASAALAPYVREQMKFFVAKVDIRKVRRDARGTVVLSPLRFTYESSELRLPVRLGLLNAEGPQDLLIYVLHPTRRFEVANLPNLPIPTNLAVHDSVRSDFNSFYGDLFDATVQSAGGRAVITEYVWSSTSCDPCPVPPLPEEHMLSLGGKEQPIQGAQRPLPSSEPRVTPLDPPVQGVRITYPQPGRISQGKTTQVIPYVITRLHARYDKNTLTEDLIFSEAAGLWGGRAGGHPIAEPTQIHGAAGGSFQARYAILHEWEGAIACTFPRRGLWGARPGGDHRNPIEPTVAQDPAYAGRGRFDLKKVIRTVVPSLGITGRP